MLVFKECLDAFARDSMYQRVLVRTLSQVVTVARRGHASVTTEWSGGPNTNNEEAVLASLFLGSLSLVNIMALDVMRQVELATVGTPHDFAEEDRLSVAQLITAVFNYAVLALTAFRAVSDTSESLIYRLKEQ